MSNRLRQLERTIKKREVYLRDVARFMERVSKIKCKKYKFAEPIEFEIKESFDRVYLALRGHYFSIEELIVRDKEELLNVVLKGNE